MARQTVRMAARVRAPELAGQGWLNTGGQALSLAGLRGKVVLLDFWTFCCVNCLHVLDELRELEQKYADVLVVVGVHSPKFEHERELDAVASALERYHVAHPVLNDPDLETWKQYAVRAWPTLAVIDPEGYVVAQMSGEGHGHAIDALIEELVVVHEAKGSLHRGAGLYVPPDPEPTTLRFPAKAIALPDGNILVADAGNHSLAELAANGETLIRRIGGGRPGFADGTGASAMFNEPNGLCLLPEDIRAEVGYDVVVADTVNHALRSVRLRDGRVQTLAGTGNQWMQGDPLPDKSPVDAHLSSPWDVVWHPDWREVAIAMAGNHQIWSFDPLANRLTTRAGTTAEGLVDGEALSAWLAQPSGLATGIQGNTLWFVDAETSSLRRIRNGVVHTEIGQGLFDFGFVDGSAKQALLQHPLGCCVLPDGSVAIADTYNGAVRRLDPETSEVTTLIDGLAEPSGLIALGELLLVVESNAHRLTRIRLPDNALVRRGDRLQAHRPPLEVKRGTLAIEVVFTPPPGQKLDDRYGPATHVAISASPPELIAEGAGRSPELRRLVVVSDAVEEGLLHVSARAASCDEESAAFPACHVHQQDWGVPVLVSEEGTTLLELPLMQRDDVG